MIDKTRESPWKRGVVAIVSLWLLQLLGCAGMFTTKHYPQYQWEADPWIVKEEQTGRKRFQVESFTLKPTGARTALVSGRVIEYAFEVITVETRKVYPYGRSHPRIEYEKGRVLKTEWVRRIPSQLVITNPYGPNTAASVLESGIFEAVVTCDEPYFFQRPPRPDNPYRAVFQYANRSKFELIPELAPVDRPDKYTGYTYDKKPGHDYTGHLLGPLSVWGYDVDWDRVREFVSDYFPRMDFEVKDKITRLPVSPTVRVTGVSVPSREALKQRFSHEFKEDSIVGKALSYVPQYLQKGETMEVNAQAFSFQAIAGVSYKVETIHGNYYYFTANISAAAGKNYSKVILLVEKGSKIRVEGVKEGEGGEIVDK